KKEKYDKPKTSFLNHLKPMGLDIGVVQGVHTPEFLYIFSILLFYLVQDVIDGYDSNKYAGLSDNGKCITVVFLKILYGIFTRCRSLNGYKVMVDKSRYELVFIGKQQVADIPVIDKMVALIHHIHVVQCFHLLAHFVDLLKAFLYCPFIPD